jgi:integrase
MVDLYEQNHQNQTSYKTAQKFFIEKFKNHFKEDTRLSSIGYGDLKAYRNKLMKSINQHDRLLTPSSINSEMSCLRQVFEEAAEMTLESRRKIERAMIEKNPFNDGKSLRLKADNERDRFSTPDEARKLFNKCPVHLQHIIECVLYTGMMRKEVLNLKWNQIRNDWIYLEDTKTGKGKIPVSTALQKLFDCIKDRQKKTGSK